MNRIDQFVWDIQLRFKIWWRDHMSGRHIFSGLVWWFMFRKYKNCRSLCVGCKQFDECFENVKQSYRASRGAR